MKIIITLFRLLFAIYLLAFAGAIVGGFTGLTLAVLDLLEFDHVLWLMEAGAGLLIVWGFVATGDGSTVEFSESPKPKAHAIELFDDEGPFINLHPHEGIWPM